MNNRIIRSLMVPALCITWFFSLAAHPLDGTPGLEKLSLSLEKSLDSLFTEKGRLAKEGETVAAQIDVLAAKELRSPGEHRQLEKLLQNSQSIAGRMESVNQAMQVLQDRYHVTLGRLVESIGSDLRDISERIESASASEKGSLFVNLQDLLKKRTVWESRLSQATASSAVVLSPAVEIAPWNSREEIQLKGDWLMDEAQAVREEILRLEKRIRSLREERDVRKNVSELSKELALFDEHEELIGRRMEPSGASAIGTQEGGKRNGFSDWETGGSGGTFSPAPASPDASLPAGVAASRESAGRDNRLPAELDGQIARLEKTRKRLILHADSLEHRALQFYKKA